MAQSLLTTAFAEASLWVETALGGIGSVTTAVVQQVKATGANVFVVEIDNTANAVVLYVKMFLALVAGVVLGTTAPDFVLPVPASAKMDYLIVTGPAYPTALAATCVTTGGTAGTVGPQNAVAVRIAFS